MQCVFATGSTHVQRDSAVSAYAVHTDALQFTGHTLRNHVTLKLGVGYRQGDYLVDRVPIQIPDRRRRVSELVCGLIPSETSSVPASIGTTV